MYGHKFAAEDSDALSALVSSERFMELDADVQDKIIDSLQRNAEQKIDGGVLGKFLGIKPANLAIHAALIICIALIIVFAADCIFAYRSGKSLNMELLKAILPVISLSVGYIFGRANK